MPLIGSTISPKNLPAAAILLPAKASASVGATLRDYTVVIPVDTTRAATDYETAIGFYQILNQGNGNLTNEPLKPKAPTLSRTDMITFQ